METSTPSALCATQTAEQLDEIEIEIDEGTQWPRIPDGTYHARLIRCEPVALQMFRGAGRLFVHFEIVDQGPFMGTRLYGAWSVDIRKVNGKTRLKAPRKGRLHVTLRRLLGPTARADRLSLASLKECVLKVRTRTVTRNHRQQHLPEAMQYSVVDEIEEVVAGAIA